MLVSVYCNFIKYLKGEKKGVKLSANGTVLIFDELAGFCIPSVPLVISQVHGIVCAFVTMICEMIIYKM